MKQEHESAEFYLWHIKALVTFVEHDISNGIASKVLRLGSKLSKKTKWKNAE
jgi:hypothetical protein